MVTGMLMKCLEGRLVPFRVCICKLLHLFAILSSDQCCVCLRIVAAFCMEVHANGSARTCPGTRPTHQVKASAGLQVGHSDTTVTATDKH